MTKPLEETYLRSRSLTVRAIVLCVAIGALLVAEFFLGLAFSRSLDTHMMEFTEVDRRGQRLLNAAGKLNDFLFDLTLAHGVPANLQPLLMHWHSHLVAMGPIEAELARQGRVVSANLSDLRQLSFEIQIDPTPEHFATYVNEVRSAVEIFSREALHMLVEIDSERKRISAKQEEDRFTYSMLMLGLGIAGAFGVVITGLLFIRDITTRFSQLSAKASQIAKGDFGPPLANSSRDELGDVIEAVNTVSTTLAKRNRQVEELHLHVLHQEKMQTLGTFASGIAHEIGNPIQAISALCYQVSDSLGTDISAGNVMANVRLVESIGAHADRLARTIAELRDFAYQAKPTAEPVDTNEIVRTTVDLMRFDPRFKRLALKLDLGTHNPMAVAVGDHLVQVIMNLLSNAADAVSDEGGEIVLATSGTEAVVTLSVQDTGAGMPPHVLEHASEPFFTTKSRSKGTGMGLAICRSIAEYHNGTLAIISEDGKGTTVTMTIPRGQI